MTAAAGGLADLKAKLESSGVTKVVTSPSWWLVSAAVLVSGVLGGDVIAAVMVAACAVLGGLFGARTPLGRALTGPVCAMSFGVCAAAALGPVPGAVLRRLQFIAVTLATPLLLLSCNLKELRGAPARRLLGAFSLGALCTICAALISALLLRSRLIATLGGWATASQAIAALTSKNIGSGINFVAVAQALHMKPLIVAASLAVDSAVGVVYFPLAASLTPKNTEATEVVTETTRLPNSWSLTDCASTFLVALAIAFLSHQFSPAGYACITSSILAVLLATLPQAEERWPAGEMLGWPLMYIYFAAAGFTVGAVPGETLLRFSPLIDFGILLYVFHLVLLLAAGRLFQLQQAELLVASSANIGGPATASSLATSKSWERLKRPALIVGTFGNAIASTFGLLFFQVLKRWP